MVLSGAVLLLAACDNNKTTNTTELSAKEALALNEGKNMMGTYTLGDKTYTEKVSIQNLKATGQFAVLCLDNTDPNEPILIQFVFKEEASARTDGYKTPAFDQGKEQAMMKLRNSKPF